MTHEERKKHFEAERRELLGSGLTAVEYIVAVAHLARKWRVST